MEFSNKTSISTIDCGINIGAWGIAISCLYLLLFPPALFLNILIFWIYTRLKSTSTFMVYLKHLAMADLLMCLTFPIRAASELPSASPALKAFSCRFSSVLFYLGMNISVILMGLISLDRFFKIVKPGGKLLQQNLFFGHVLCIMTWVLFTGLINLPIIITSDQDPTNKTDEFCMAMKSAVGRTWHEIAVMVSEVTFWLVFILIIFCYLCIGKKVLNSYQKLRSSHAYKRHKAMIRVFLILLVFVICYIPYHSVRIPYTKLQVQPVYSCPKVSYKIFKDFTLWLLVTNVCLDPLIYFFLCKAFRQKFEEYCKCFGLFCNKKGDGEIGSETT